jgi:Zn-dependent protease with chaperone function
MLPVNGFYGHVRRNDLRSAAMFAGFAVAFQLVAAAMLLLPLLVFDPMHAPIFFPAEYMSRYAPVVFLAGCGLFLKMFRRHVASVRASVDFADVTRRDEPRLVRIVETQALAAGLPIPKVGLIESPALNAFACGLGPSSAVVVATRGLVEALDDDELAAVVAHEIAHIRNGDIRLVAAANVLVDCVALVQRYNLLRIEGWKTVLLAVVITPFLYLVLMAGFVTWVGLTIARVSRLLISTSREYVADAEAVRMTHNPAALISALRRIEGRSTVEGLSPQADVMMIDGAVEGAFASHPTIADRIAVLTRLSGGMALGGGVRRDTRPAAQALAAREGAFGRRRPAPAAAAAPRGLIGRVNAGSGRNMFNLTARTKRMLVIGFAGVAALQFLVVLKVSPPAGSRPSATSSLDALRELRGEPTLGTIGGTAASPLEERRHLARDEPAEAGCFHTDRYSVGDRGLRRLATPDAALIASYARGDDYGSSDVVAERYLSLRLRTIRAVEATRDGERDRALLAYVTTRKSMLQVMHRFFDEAGLRLMQDAYDAPADRAILSALRQRLTDGATPLPADARLMKEIRFLVERPGEFLPCQATRA